MNEYLRNLNSYLAPSGERAEMVMATIVIAVVITLIMPLPPTLLDVLIATNISISAFLTVFALQLRDVLQLTTFPSLLLLTTLFRLSLSVASTRLILLDAHAGHIIEAFGKVTVGGNLVVGIVIFLILTVVQFLVITKGSERVAEVGARFTLDGMPGKQMAIDMELRANTLTAEQARTRRAKVVQESQFFGAMDGAMKFVKGDALAGIIIMLTNMIGGLGIGVLQRGMAASDALRLYTILTVGDGLVAQLPALLTSLTAGLIVTRVSNASEAGPLNIGREILAQIMDTPRAWIAAGGAMCVFGMIPGMPLPIFMALAAGATGTGIYRIKKSRRETTASMEQEKAVVANRKDFDIVQHYVLQFGSHVSDVAQSRQILNAIRVIRNQIVAKYGMFLPTIELGDAIALAPFDFQFSIDEIPIFKMTFDNGRFAAHCDRGVLASYEIAEFVEEKLEFSDRHAYWIAADDKERLDRDGIRCTSYTDMFLQRVETIFYRTGYRYVGIEEAQKIAKWVGSKFPELAKELERTVPPSRLAEVLQRLVAERVGIRNVRVIVETLVEWAQRERDVTILAECVRCALRRQICEEFGSANTLNVFLLEPGLENLVRDSVRQTSYGNFVTLEQESVELLVGSMRALLEKSRDVVKPVILTTQDVRPHLRRLLEEPFFDVPIISYNEITPEYSVRTVGVIGSWHEDSRPSV
ncbi:type III secretion system export apparatus subunit SctV [Burkholderia ubonensis]|uniref:type III secretion system export apparatus subunit SctV n=1 Tax=Burkholderia ubonensis TaxID=101571 RepID=UPI0007C7FA8B|nr:type III secretion system export apparatus subunit SctV [Burkholderia ubonensis]